MKHVHVVILFVLVNILLACARNEDNMKKGGSFTPTITREYLQMHGFKEQADNPGVFEREHIRLSDASHDLGFAISSLQRAVNLPYNLDERTVIVGNTFITVQSKAIEGPESEKYIFGGYHPLDDPKTICTVYVILNKLALVQEYAKTDSTPVLRIISVQMPADKSKPWQITFELNATGKHHVAMQQRDFGVRVTSEVSHLDIRTNILFPKQTPDIITIWPGKLMIFTVDMQTNAIHDVLESPGKYNLQIDISAGKRQRQTIDYEWFGREYLSDKYIFTIK